MAEKSGKAVPFYDIIQQKRQERLTKKKQHKIYQRLRKEMATFSSPPHKPTFTRETEDEWFFRRVSCPSSIFHFSELDDTPQEACETHEQVSEDSDYDTDLEDEEPPRQSMTPEILYTRLCHKYRIVPITSFLKQMKEQEMSLAYQALGPNDTKALAAPLQVNLTVSSLNLEGNCMGNEGIGHMAFMLLENNTITHLNLSHNHLGWEGCRILCGALLRTRYITHVNLAGNGLTDRGASYVAQVIHNNKYIVELDLRENKLTCTGAAIISKALEKNESLSHLDLSWNHIRMDGAKHIAQALKVNYTLRWVDLSMNGFSDTGTLSLASALKDNVSLQHLDLTNNRIGVNGALALSHALLVNKDLETIALGLNPISFIGAKALIDALENNDESNIGELLLHGVLVDKQFMEVVDRINRVRPVQVVMGKVVSFYEMETEEIYKPTDDNPLELLLMYMSEQNLRLLDLFKKMDKNHDGTLSRDEIVRGMEELATPLTAHQVEQLINMLDKDGDGSIDLQEIMNINVEFRDLKRKATNKVKARKSTVIVPSRNSRVSMDSGININMLGISEKIGEED